MKLRFLGQYEENPIVFPPQAKIYPGEVREFAQQYAYLLEHTDGLGNPRYEQVADDTPEGVPEQDPEAPLRARLALQAQIVAQIQASQKR